MLVKPVASRLSTDDVPCSAYGSLVNGKWQQLRFPIHGKLRHSNAIEGSLDLAFDDSCFRLDLKKRIRAESELTLSARYQFSALNFESQTSKGVLDSGILSSTFPRCPMMILDEDEEVNIVEVGVGDTGNLSKDF